MLHTFGASNLVGGLYKMKLISKPVLTAAEYFFMDFSAVLAVFFGITLVIGITLVFRLAFPRFDHEGKVKEYVKGIGGNTVLGTYFFSSIVGLVICTLITLSLKSDLM